MIRNTISGVNQGIAENFYDCSRKMPMALLVDFSHWNLKVPGSLPALSV